MGRPNRKAERREEILVAAMRLIESHDPATLRLVDIAADLGVTPNAVRYYFHDLDELLVAVALRSDIRFFDNRREAVRSIPDPRKQLVRMVADGLPAGRQDAEWRSIWRAFLAAGFELDQRPEIRDIYHRQVGLYAEVLQAGAQQQVFDLEQSPVEIARTVMSLEDYLGYRIIARDDRLDREAALKLMLGYLELATGVSLVTADSPPDDPA